MAYASLLACSSSQQPNLRRRRAWRFPHSCPDASGACRIGRRTISPVGEQLSSLRTSEGNDMKIDGRCHCGYVRFEAEADPETATICNCTDCQTMSGAPLRAIVATRPGTFVLLS